MVSLKHHNCRPGLRTECATYRDRSSPRPQKVLQGPHCGVWPDAVRSLPQHRPTLQPDLQAKGLITRRPSSDSPYPRTVSLVGYDDIQVVQWLGPSLTPFDSPVTEMAEQATIMVLWLAAGDTLQTERLDLATDLVIRASTAPPRPVRSGRR